MKLDLRIIPRPHPEREAVGWFIPAADPAVWLSIITQAGQALNAVEVRVVPRAADDPAPLGALLSAPNWTDPPTPLAQPYGRFAGRLFLPTHARLVPALDEAELVQQLMTPSAVFHPVVGLVGFEDDQVLSALSLIRTAAPQPAAWSMPEPGPEIVARLRSLQPTVPLTLDDVEDQLNGQVDQRPLDELPPAPGEKAPGLLGKAGLGTVAGIAGAAAWLTSKVPRTASKRTWIDALHDWAASHQRQPGQVDQQQRNREINRLLEMLKNSPELGLSFAIPMSGLAKSRGTGFGSNELTRRSTGFSLSGLFGGGAADPWDIAHQQQLALLQSYRQLAVEEAQKGRYRRAAYIYGTLLGDIEASASVLEEGGHYDEAAVILRDKLNQPIAAARCLERGGRLSDAIALYLEHNHWIEAAGLYDRLDQKAEAARWYRHAASQLIEARSYLQAAALLEEKLDDVDEAQRVLDAGWKPPNRDWACVAKLFDLLGRHGRGPRAATLMDELARAAGDAQHAGRLARTLAEVRAAYPAPALREAMAGRVIRLAGEHLPNQPTPAQARPFTEAIAALAPDDRLLTRDTRRYIDQLARAMPVKKQQTRPPQSVITLASRASAPAGRWSRMFATGRGLYLLGAVTNHAEQLYVSCITGLDHGKPVVISSPINNAYLQPDLPFSAQILCELVSHESNYPSALFVSIPGKPKIPNQRCFEGIGDSEITVGHLDRWSGATLAVSAALPSQTWVLTGTTADSMELVLNAYNTDMQLIQSIPITLHEDQIAQLHALDKPPAICLHARKDYVILALGPLVLKFIGGHQVQAWSEIRPVVNIRGAVPFGRSRYALFYDQGLRVVWDQPGHELADQRALSTIDHPVGTMTNNSGLLAVAHARGCHLYASTRHGELRLIEDIHWPSSSSSNSSNSSSANPPTDVVAVGNQDDFAVLFQDGTVQWCSVSPPIGKRY